jgi:hypothetical protein
LAGYLLGGAVDADVLALIGLLGQPVRLAAVLACGHPAQAWTGAVASLREGSSLDRPDSLFDLILVGLSVSW